MDDVAPIAVKLRVLGRRRCPVAPHHSAEWQAADLIESQQANHAMLSTMFDRLADERDQLERVLGERVAT